jgi:hypothetical protein
MITKALIDKRDRAQEALDQLSAGIFTRMAIVAHRLDLDEMVFTLFGNSYLRGTREVKSKQLDALDQFYYDNVHSGGHQSVWTPEKGWGA